MFSAKPVCQVDCDEEQPLASFACPNGCHRFPRVSLENDRVEVISAFLHCSVDDSSITLEERVAFSQLN